MENFGVTNFLAEGGRESKEKNMEEGEREKRKKQEPIRIQSSVIQFFPDDPC